MILFDPVTDLMLGFILAVGLMEALAICGVYGRRLLT